MPAITVNLSQAQWDAMTTDCVSPSEWVENAASAKAQNCTDEIISKLIAHCNANDVQIAQGADAQVTQAFTLGVVSALSANSGAEE